MSFIDTKFPDSIAYGAENGANYSTDVVVVDSGQEQRNSRWASPLWSANVGQVNKTLAETEELVAFFRAVANGKLNSFRFKDFSDYQVTVATGRAVGIASSPATRYQLVKRYTSGGQVDDRTITKPVSATVAIYVSSVLQTLTTHYTIDYTTGIINFVLAQTASNITWAGQFDVHARFDTDSMPVVISDKNAYTWGSIPLLEIRAT